MDTVSGPIDWALGGQYQSPVDAAQQGSAFGLSMGQKVATLNALRGVDFSNPGSTDTAIQGLVHAGAADQASALIGLENARDYRNLAVGFYGQNQPGSQPSASATTNAAQTPTPPAQPPPGAAAPAAPTSSAQPPAPKTVQYGDTQLDPTAASAHIDQIEAVLSKVKSVPPEQRQALAAQLGPTVGIDPTKITPDQLTDESLTAATNTLESSRHVVNGNTMSLPQYQSLVGSPAQQDPFTAAQIERLSMFNPEAGTAMGQAFKLNHPDLQQTSLPGVMYDPVRKVTVQVAPGEDIAAQAGMTAGAESQAKHQVDIAFAKQDAWAAAQKASAVATAEEAAKAPYEFMDVTRPDGTVGKVRKDFAVGYAAGHGGLLGQGPSASEASYLASIGPQAAELLKPDEAGRQQAQNTEATARRALSTIGSMKMDNLTPIKADAAGWLRTFGVPNKEVDSFTNDAVGYKSLTNEALTQGAHQSFPSRITNSDIALYHTITPGLTTPNDAAKMYFGTQAAIAQRKQEYEDWKSQYTGEHTPQAIESAWIHGPGAKSIFQYPAWQNIQVGGKPAVVVKNVNGHNVAAFGIGTGHPFYFPVQ